MSIKSYSFYGKTLKEDAIPGLTLIVKDGEKDGLQHVVFMENSKRKYRIRTIDKQAILEGETSEKHISHSVMLKSVSRQNIGKLLLEIAKKEIHLRGIIYNIPENYHLFNRLNFSKAIQLLKESEK